MIRQAAASDLPGSPVHFLNCTSAKADRLSWPFIPEYSQDRASSRGWLGEYGGALQNLADIRVLKPPIPADQKILTVGIWEGAASTAHAILQC